MEGEGKGLKKERKGKLGNNNNKKEKMRRCMNREGRSDCEGREENDRKGHTLQKLGSTPYAASSSSSTHPPFLRFILACPQFLF